MTTAGRRLGDGGGGESKSEKEKMGPTIWSITHTHYRTMLATYGMWCAYTLVEREIYHMRVIFKKNTTCCTRKTTLTDVASELAR
jgi:hypothetical protein